MSFRDGKNGTITGVGKISRSVTRALEEVYHIDGLKHNFISMEEIYHVDGLQHNFLSISHICDKRNNVTFTFVGCQVKKLDVEDIVLMPKDIRIFIRLIS